MTRFSAAEVAPPTKSTSCEDSQETNAPLAFASSAPTGMFPMRN